MNWIKIYLMVGFVVAVIYHFVIIFGTMRSEKFNTLHDDEKFALKAMYGKDIDALGLVGFTCFIILVWPWPLKILVKSAIKHLG